MRTEIRCLKLDRITATTGTQIRASMNTEVVGQYAEAMKDLANNKFPPVVVFQTGDEYILADGFHRIAAAKVNGFTDIEADIRPGKKADALWYALTANRAHGMQLSAPDKKRSIILALENFPTKSQQEIANHVGCDQGYVSRVKADVMPVITSPKRTDSKGRIQPTRKPRKASPPPSSAQIVVPEPISTTVVVEAANEPPNAQGIMLELMKEEFLELDEEHRQQFLAFANSIRRSAP
jgi:hypothetical protein